MMSKGGESSTVASDKKDLADQLQQRYRTFKDDFRIFIDVENEDAEEDEEMLTDAG